MVAYLDSSLVLRHILLGERQIAPAFECERTVSSELMEIECRRVLQRCRMEGDLDDQGFLVALSRLEALLRGLDLVEMSAWIKRRAMESFPVSIKTLDALHLATALKLVERSSADSMSVFTHDRSMNLCARALGFETPLFEM